MKFSTKALAAEQARTDCLIVFAYADGSLSKAAQALDRTVKGALARVLKSRDITGKTGSSLVLRDLSGISAARVLLVGAGAKDQWSAKTFADAMRAAFKAALGTGAKNVSIASTDALKDRDAAWSARHAVILASEATYRFDELKSKPAEPQTVLESVELLYEPNEEAAVKNAVAEGQAIAAGMELTKTLGNRPGNICTPTHLAETAQDLGKRYKFKVDVLERKQIEALGMGSFLSVTKGSVEPPRFIVMQYDGSPGASAKSDKADKGGKGSRKTGKTAPIVLVGKGITFDTGGISIKPSEAMDEMKYDMCGAGTVLGTFRALAELKLPIHVVGLIATCENMPSGTATRPGDVVKSMSGQTIEILNTDAEGRLILADALTYAERFEPAAVIDIATLTGACVVALGHINTGLFSTSEALAEQLGRAGKTMLDPAWRMPVEDDYQDLLDSNFADMANIGGRPGGAITAACFLSRFAKKYEWAHLDIAGTAWKSGKAKGASGRPVPLLVEFLRTRATTGAA